MPYHPVASTADLDALPPGRLLAVRARGWNLALVRLDGRLFAVEDRCPHMTFPLSKGVAREGRLICTLHHWEFDLAGGQRDAPPEARCRTFGVREEDGRILVDLPAS